MMLSTLPPGLPARIPHPVSPAPAARPVGAPRFGQETTNSAPDASNPRRGLLITLGLAFAALLTGLLGLLLGGRILQGLGGGGRDAAIGRKLGIPDPHRQAVFDLRSLDIRDELPAELGSNPLLLEKARRSYQTLVRFYHPDAVDRRLSKSSEPKVLIDRIRKESADRFSELTLVYRRLNLFYGPDSPWNPGRKASDIKEVPVLF